MANLNTEFGAVFVVCSQSRYQISSSSCSSVIAITPGSTYRYITVGTIDI